MTNSLGYPFFVAKFRARAMVAVMARTILMLMFSFAAWSAELSGIVTEVHDGDSLTLVNWNATYKIRLADIDAPELNQPYGRDAAASLFHMCTLKRAIAETVGEDRNGRTLARVTCAGVDTNTEQVRRGWAWVFERFAPKNSPLYGVQVEAKTAKRGLWRSTDAVPPWEWRREARRQNPRN